MPSKRKTTVTKEEAKPARVPKLRFPEFRGAGDWTTETLGSVARISTEKVGDKAAIPMSITSGVGLVSQMDKFGRIIAGSSYANYLLLKKDDFAYNKSATKEFPEGFIALYSGDELAAVPNSIFTCFRIKGESPVAQYLNYLFLGNLHGRWLRKFIEVGARAHGSLSINEDDLLALPVPLPSGKRSVAEQQKIAECLSSVDEVIAAQARKVDALKTHKKGLMQQLFPREGETQPRVRFPEFQNAGEWEVKPFDELVNFQSGGTPSKANPTFWNGSVPWVSAKDMKQFFLDDAEDHISAAAVDEGAKVVPPGTLLMLVRGMTLLKDVPICVVRRQMSFNQDVKALRPVDGIDGLFLALLLMGSKDRLLEMVTVAGHGTGKLDTNELKAMVLMLPSLPEQQRIATCLSSLDALITAETQKHAALQRHKRGLLQQLFPPPEDQNTL
jgi:type I restriction enzyme S subunit